MINLNIEYFKSVNYAQINNGIGICQSVSVKSDDSDLHDVYVECEGEYFIASRTAVMPLVPAKKTIKLSDFCIKPDALKAAALTEKLTTTFKVNIWSDASSEETKQLIHSKEYAIDLLPYDYWLGTGTLPQMIASFVTPNHPSINQIISKAAVFLKELTGSSAFYEYQTDNVTNVVKQVAAVYGALHSENIVYRAMPASFEKDGQRVTLPAQVLASKLANCIELSVLFASVLESIGINTGIVIQQGHAYLAVWLVNDCYAYSVCDDPSYIEKKCSEGINEMLVLETTKLTDEATSFADAINSANLKLADHSQFVLMVDIHRCRLDGYLPLPQIIEKNGKWEMQVDEGVEHDKCVIEVQERSRYDLTQVADDRELSRMDIWERKLLDFTLRNTMLNLSLRQRAIQLISFDVDKIEDNLEEGTEYLVMEKPDAEINHSLTPNPSPNGEGSLVGKLIRSKSNPQLQPIISNDIQHNRLHTYRTESESRDTLKKIYRTSRNAIEETGANSLFLAIGALRWYETDLSETPRYAPILMLPVDMVYKKRGYYIRTRDEEIMLNITLIEFLRQNYGIEIPGIYPLPKDDHGVDVTLIFSMIREALKNQRNWDVEEECILGVFSFSKFLMWNDIHNHREEMLESKVIDSLVQQRLTWQPELLGVSGGGECQGGARGQEGGESLKELDKSLTPDQLSLPVAADSSQMAAIIEAGRGHSFILYGPPGTGKSQTITNLIANALFQGKRVLFVAEKMAALSVVQSRLAKIGLDPFCLEMHSNKITKRHVLEQLSKALKVTHIASPEEYARTAESLYAERMKLIEYMEALHENKGEDGFSLYDCILRYDENDCKPLEGDILNDTLNHTLSPTSINEFEHLLGDRLEAVMKLVGQPSQHPLMGMSVEEADLASETALRDNINKAIATINNTVSSYATLIATREQREQILRDSNESIFSADVNALYDEWRKIGTKWFLPRFFAKRSFVERMRQYSQYVTADNMDKLLNDVIDYNKHHAAVCEMQSVAAHYFNASYALDELPTKEAMQEMAAKLTKWNSNLTDIRDWYHWCAYRQQLMDKGLNCVVSTLEQQEVKAQDVLPMTMKAIFQAKAKQKIGASSVLRTFEGMIFDDTVTLYKKLTADFQLLSQKELYAKLAAQIPHVTDNVDSSSEIGLLNRNISNGGRGTSLRDLMSQIPTLLPRLCPCMLMSPMSVAQFLALDQEKFDLVIFDEASQMPTSEAVGAIARGKALVVVGDPKQMPPTSFFVSTNVDEDEADIDDLESILEDCKTLEMPSLQLNWHYRSQHESLIAFSNNEYYDGELITFPSIDDQETKVKLVPINGVYDKGGRRSNKAEAEAIVKEVERRLSDAELCQHSIGIIAFSVVQQNLIEDLLQERLDSSKALREAADNMYEPIFVKNLENVQGDERDIILFSIGYGPDKNGKVSMNFGPLNNKGGERRLNVAVSRSRQEMMVFSTLRSAHIDLRRSNAKGVEGLKHFLEYAEQQILVQSENSIAGNNDIVIANQIANALTERGYIAEVAVGRSKFKVDVAIGSKSQPEVYQLGILLDGNGYHNTQTTRDREIVQPSVLSNLHWQVMRVWSVDWFNNRERVINRIIEHLEEVHASSNHYPSPTTQTFDISNETVIEPESNAQEYEEYSTTQKKAQSMSDYALASAILSVEQPMSLMQLCRRACSLRQIARVTPTIIRDFTAIAEQSFFITPDRTGTTVWLDKQSAESYTSYRANNGRDIADIPMAEIKNAVLEAIREQLSIGKDALALITAKKLGFTRRGTNVEDAFRLAVSELTKEGKITMKDDSIMILP